MSMKFHKNVFMVLPALLLPVLVLLSGSPSAGADGVSDVVINTTQAENVRRFEADIIYRDTTFYYDLISVAENVESGERYINSGVWREANGSQADSFTVTVKNRSNRELSTETVFTADDFISCGAGIQLRGEGRHTVPSVEVSAEKTVVFETVTEAVFGPYPDLGSYRGTKHITATVIFRQNS